MKKFLIAGVTLLAAVSLSACDPDVAPDERTNIESASGETRSITIKEDCDGKDRVANIWVDSDHVPGFSKREDENRITLTEPGDCIVSKESEVIAEVKYTTYAIETWCVNESRFGSVKALKTDGEEFTWQQEFPGDPVCEEVEK